MAAARRAEILLWLGLALFLAGIGIGLGWDRRWHATHPFEQFWSPPHLFIYGNTLLSAAVFAYLARHPRLRAAFGPGPLLLLGSGFAVLGLGGLLDDLWHSTFGLDETSWSLPHHMLGQGILLASLGFVSCRLALSSQAASSSLRSGAPGDPALRQPLPWYVVGLLAWLLLAVAPSLVGGPILRNPPPNGLRAIAAIPVLAADAAFQHTTRIYLQWHLDRTNWLFMPLVAFTVGFALRLAQRLTGPRDRWLVLVSALGLGLGLLGARAESAGWARVLLAPPLLPAALGYALARRVGAPGRWAWLGAGWGACAASLLWVPNPILALACGPLALPGVWLAERVVGLVEAPSRRAVIGSAVTIGLVLPVLTGALDLYWRLHTP